VSQRVSFFNFKSNTVKHVLYPAVMGQGRRILPLKKDSPSGREWSKSNNLAMSKQA